MNYFKRALTLISIRLVSAGVGFVVELNSCIDFEIIELILIAAAAIMLLLTLYNDQLKKAFPYFLLGKSGFDAIYLLTLNSAGYITGLIIVSNIIFGMVFASDLLMKHLLNGGKYSRFAGIAFTVCLIMPFIAVFLSLATVISAVLFYEISILLLIIVLIVNACILIKTCCTYINFVLLTVII